MMEPLVMPFSLPGQEPKKFIGTPGDHFYEGIRNPNRSEFDRHNKLYEAVANEGRGSFVEVGANIGTATMFASDFFLLCVAFEPNPLNNKHLQINRMINNAGNICIRSQAVSDFSGDAIFYCFPETNSGGHSLIKSVVDVAKEVQVRVVTLDEALPGMRDCRMLHIDTEGHDLKVLKGATEFLKHQETFPLICMEFNPEYLRKAGSSLDDLKKFLNEFKCEVWIHLQSYVQVSLTDLENWWNRPDVLPNGWVDLYLINSSLPLSVLEMF
jgi:FkbM family methyltransferase